MGRKRKIRRRGKRRVRPMKKIINGGLVRGSQHPRTTSASPWNCYTLTTTWKPTAVGLSCFTSSQVQKLFKAELGLTDALKCDIRVTRVDVWTPPAAANSDRNYIVLAPSDWTHENDKCDDARNINWYEAWGTAVQPAHLHYVWPKSMSTQVINRDVDVPLVRFDIAVISQSYIVKVHMQWRPSIPDPRPLNVGQMSSFSRQPPPPGTDFVYVDGHGAFAPMCV